jgi:Redoxin
MREAQLLCALIAVSFITTFGCSHQPPEVSRTRPAALTLIDLDGKPFNWVAKPSEISVAVFTRTDCPISNRYAPEVRRLYERFHDKNVAFYLIYVDPDETVEAIRKHLQEFNYPCQALRDPTHAFTHHCEATTTPEAVVFDKNGIKTYQGRIDDWYSEVGQSRTQPTSHDLADAIESTLQGKPVANPRTQAVGCVIADLKN